MSLEVIVKELERAIRCMYRVHLHGDNLLIDACGAVGRALREAKEMQKK